MTRRTLVAGATVGALVVGLGVVQLVDTGTPLTATPAAAQGLIAYDDCESLLESYRDELARDITPYGFGGRRGFGADFRVKTRFFTDGGSIDFGTSTGFAGSTGTATSGGATTGSSSSTATSGALNAIPNLSGPAIADSGSPVASTALDAVGVGETGTNVQERGVDEPDIVKLSGEHLLTIVAGSLQVITTGDEPQRVATLAVPDRPYQPDQDGFSAYYVAEDNELLVSGSRVLLIQRGWRELPEADPAGAPADGSLSGSSTGSSRPYAVQQPTSSAQTVLHLADLSDPTAPRWLESAELDGSYVSARLIDGTVRLVTRSLPRVLPVVEVGRRPDNRPDQVIYRDAIIAQNRDIAERASLSEVLPQMVRRDASGEVLTSGQAVDCADVSYAAGTPGIGTLTVTTLRPGAGLDPVDTTAVRADGDLVYASTERLIVATSQWGTNELFARPVGPDDEVTTQLHAFDLTDPATLRYTGSGSVKGYVYGRWALSWHNGSLRVATTTGQPWGPQGPQTESRVTVLQEGGREQSEQTQQSEQSQQSGELVEVGRVDGLGKGEKIYAVRYFGDLATVVTFRQTDPLYVVDLKDPTAPAVLGELKIPGFSTYLHPIGEDKLLGIGMEADEQTGRTLGMQASVYSIEDLSKPLQVDRLQLGQGYSDALDESRAFSYDPARRLAVLPFASFDGRSQFTGALGIQVGADGTLSEAGRVPVSANGRFYDRVRRVTLSDEHLHLLTSSFVITGTVEDFERTGAVALR